MSDSQIHLSLSVKSLQRLETVNHARDFAFIVGDERYPCPSFVAELLSPRVVSLRSQDITINEFSVKTEDPDHHFEVFLSIGFGREVSFSESEMKFVRSVCGELWNSELFEKTIKHEKGRITKADLKARLDFLSGSDRSCECEIGAIASQFYEFSLSDLDHLSPSVLEAILSDSRLVVQDEDSLFEIIHRRASVDLSYFGLLEFVRFEFLSDDCMARALGFMSRLFESLTFGIWSRLRTRLLLSVTPHTIAGRFVLPEIESTIISTVPAIFSVFGDKKFRLLYRGSRDGFQASAFHRQCDGHRNTLSFILSKNKCIFGGYTPLPWSTQGGYASDPSFESFVFTIKNPHNRPAQIFKQRQEGKAIYNGSDCGPIFGGGCDFQVHDPFQATTYNYSNLGNTYANDTRIDPQQTLTGEYNFVVDEIEVFEVI